eukprot:10203413-Heterocapsa_arctica.AAC.1
MSRATPTRAPRSRSPSLKRSTPTLTSQERQTPVFATNVAPVSVPRVGSNTGSTVSFGMDLSVDPRRTPVKRE